MSDWKISLHIVGARDPVSNVDLVPKGPLAQAFSLTFYEPGQDSIADLRAFAASYGSPATVLPYGLSNVNGRATFHLTRCPYVASIKAPIQGLPVVVDWMGYDYPFADVHQVHERAEIEVYRLDGLPQIADGSVAPPDVLQLDTQGSEYEIFEGLGDLAAGVVAVIAELSYIPFYENEPLVGEFVALMRRHGLLFTTALRDQGAQPYRLPLGLRGAPWRVQSDVLFLKELDRVTSDPVMLRKAVLIGINYNQFTYAFEGLLRYVAAYGNDFGDGPGGWFLRDLAPALAKNPLAKTRSFTDIYTLEEAYERSTLAKQRDAERTARERLMPQIQADLAEQGPIFQRLLDPADTPVEGVFRAYGLISQAQVLKETRIADTDRYLRSVGVNVTRA